MPLKPLVDTFDMIGEAVESVDGPGRSMLRIKALINLGYDAIREIEEREETRVRKDCE